MVDKLKFIETMAPYAQAHQEHFFPSITLAQQILESGWGESTLAKEANNYWGRKEDNPNVEAYVVKTQEADKDGNFYTIEARFRIYKDLDEGFKDHDTIMTRSPWYENYYKDALNAKTPKEQAEGLTGTYATDPGYANKLMNIIETYDLTKYDTQPIQDTDGKPDNVAIMPDGTRIVFQ